jgi:hypothetical protein
MAGFDAPALPDQPLAVGLQKWRHVRQVSGHSVVLARLSFN